MLPEKEEQLSNYVAQHLEKKRGRLIRPALVPGVLELERQVKRRGIDHQTPRLIRLRRAFGQPMWVCSSSF